MEETKRNTIFKTIRRFIYRNILQQKYIQKITETEDRKIYVPTVDGMPRFYVPERTWKAYAISEDSKWWPYLKYFSRGMWERWLMGWGYLELECNDKYQLIEEENPITYKSQCGATIIIRSYKTRTRWLFLGIPIKVRYGASESPQGIPHTGKIFDEKGKLLPLNGYTPKDSMGYWSCGWGSSHEKRIWR